MGKTIAHFWPEFGAWLGGLEDTRDQTRITYSRQFLSWMGMMVFLLKLGSRRQVRFELDSPEALENINRLSHSSQETIAHGDTLDHFLSHVPPGQYAHLRRLMVHRLIRMKALDGGRLYGHFLVVFDGTGQLYFVRLARQLKKDFPQLMLCLCLDGLYAKGTVMDICQENHWKYFITFKEGSMPAVWKEYQTLLELCPQNRKEHTMPQGVRQTYAWVDNLEYVDDRGHRQRFNAFQCAEQSGADKTLFAWITNFTIRPDNVVALGNRGSRCRWKIENEGFNIQKNGGFNLEHAYSTGQWQIKNFYILLQACWAKTASDCSAACAISPSDWPKASATT